MESAYSKVDKQQSFYIKISLKCLHCVDVSSAVDFRSICCLHAQGVNR
jgi:hypothetical protein